MSKKDESQLEENNKGLVGDQKDELKSNESSNKGKKDKLEIKQYSNETFEEITCDKLIKFQFKNCYIKKLILENVTEVLKPFASCKIEKIKFIGTYPVNDLTKSSFYVEGIKEVEIPKEFKNHKAKSYFPYAEIKYY